jgi:2-amino-4-hydroxy-6-hydroxymethyldihydropteridine diphosphokinase
MSHLCHAYRHFQSHGVLVRVSPIYETSPWGPVVQNDYLNAILIVERHDATPDYWLQDAHFVEQQAERQRTIHWGPRTVDIDVITVADNSGNPIQRHDPGLRAHERAFVLIPWLAADPKGELPGFGSVAELVDALPGQDKAGVRLWGSLRNDVCRE